MKPFFRPDNRLVRKWTRFWIRRGGLTPTGRFAMRMAAIFVAPHKSRVGLAHMAPGGYVAPSATIDHDELTLGSHVFIDDGSILFKREGKGRMTLADGVIIRADKRLPPRKPGALSPGPQAHLMKRGFEKYYLWKARHGNVNLP